MTICKTIFCLTIRKTQDEQRNGETGTAKAVERMLRAVSAEKCPERSVMTWSHTHSVCPAAEWLHIQQVSLELVTLLAQQADIFSLMACSVCWAEVDCCGLITVPSLQS